MGKMSLQAFRRCNTTFKRLATAFLHRWFVLPYFCTLSCAEYGNHEQQIIENALEERGITLRLA